MQIGAVTVENSIEVPQKCKNGNTRWSSKSTFEYLFKEYENTSLKRYVHPYGHCSIIYSSQDMETTWVAINRWMNG